MPNPVLDESLYDYVVLGGVRSPGVVTISGHNRKIGWDVKKGPGQSGASTTRTSEDPVEITLKFYLVQDESLGIFDFDDWPAFAAVVRSTISGKTPQALDIYHPDLAENDIKSVVLSEFGGATYDGKGGQTIEIKLLEYRPPKPQGNSPNGSKSKPKTKQKGPDPDQAALDELAKLTKQYQDTPWG